MENCPGQKQIIIVEDVESLRTLQARYLERFGHKVWQAADFSETMLLLESLPASPDIAVIDAGLPGISGLQLAKLIRLFYPDLHIIITSGLCREQLADFSAELSTALFLQKPFMPEELKKAVHAALSA